VFKYVVAGLVTALFGVAAQAAQVDVGVAGSDAGSVKIEAGTSGSVTINAPAVAGSTTITVPAGNGANGQTWITNGSGVYSFAGIPHTLGGAWAPGMLLSGVTIPLGRCPVAAATGCTITTISCALSTAVGGVATVQVWFAPSGTALSAGTKANTTDCNANGTANTAQGMGVTNASVGPSNVIGLVFPTGAGWATPGSGAGEVQVEYTVQP